MQNRRSRSTRALFATLLLTAAGALALWAPARAEAAPLVGSGVGSSSPIGAIRITKITLIPDNAAFGHADTVEVVWEVSGGDPAIQTTDFDVEVVIHRDIAGGTTRSVHLSGAARTASVNFGSRFFRGVKSADATVKATATIKAEGKKSQTF